MTFYYQDKNYQIDRYPPTTQTSLQPWSAADEHLLRYLAERLSVSTPLAICHDRFGFLACLLHAHAPISVISSKSQEKALRTNLLANGFAADTLPLQDPLRPLAARIALGLVHIPKSIDLFRLYLYQLSQALDAEGEVVCAFMTRHFSPQITEAALTFFDSATQSLAWKKSRLLVLKGPKQVEAPEHISRIALTAERSLSQYPGVFSAKQVDPATRLLIQHLRVRDSDHRVLDLATGNGVLAAALLDQRPDLEMHVLDDFFLAIASARLNLDPARTHFHYNDCLEDFEDDFFDLIVSNPPFHFEYEINIEVALRLFEEATRCLAEGGHFQLVGNRHLNYKVQLARSFRMVKILAESPKFVIYQCMK